jgi:hypothetical protein
MQPAGGRLLLSPKEWSSLADSNQGLKVKIQVRGTVAASHTAVGSSAVAALGVDATDVSGGIYYFAPVGAAGSNTGAIMRHQFGDTTSGATQFYSPTNTSGGQRCVGCHVLTHDGTKFAITYDGGNGPAAELGVAAPMGATIPESSGLKWNFGSFSPDGNRLVASTMGALEILDTSGGAGNGKVQQVLLDGSAGHYGSHPDWSPDGTQIVYVSVGQPNGQSEWSFGQGSLVVVTDQGMGMFGAPKVIVQSQGENNYYPSFSPDGKWILFNRGANQAYNDNTAEVWVVPADGSAAPTALTNANAAANLTNSWPRWSPLLLHEPDGSERMYFTFSSVRDYGIELVQPATLSMKSPQIWMAAFDPTAAKANMDPSSVSFWMPFQDVKSHNHIAQWTSTVIP